MRSVGVIESPEKTDEKWNCLFLDKPSQLVQDRNENLSIEEEKSYLSTDDGTGVLNYAYWAAGRGGQLERHLSQKPIYTKQFVDEKSLC